MNQIQEITACAFIYNSSNQLLIAKRAKTKNFLPDKWELLGGHTEFGETLQESLIRELKEELQIDIIVEDPFYAFTYVSGDIHTVEVDFFARISDNSSQIILNPEDHSEYNWIKADEVDQYFDQNDEERKAVENGFRILAGR